MHKVEGKSREKTETLTRHTRAWKSKNKTQPDTEP